MNLLHLGFCIILSHVSYVSSIMFTLQPNTQKCLREEIKKNNLLIGEFEVSDFPGQQVDYIVSNSFILRSYPSIPKLCSFRSGSLFYFYCVMIDLNLISYHYSFKSME